MLVALNGEPYVENSFSIESLLNSLQLRHPR
jgi:hypothetical protein